MCLLVRYLRWFFLVWSQINWMHVFFYLFCWLLIKWRVKKTALILNEARRLVKLLFFVTYWRRNRIYYMWVSHFLNASQIKLILTPIVFIKWKIVSTSLSFWVWTTNNYNCNKQFQFWDWKRWLVCWLNGNSTISSIVLESEVEHKLSAYSQKIPHFQ